MPPVTSMFWRVSASSSSLPPPTACSTRNRWALLSAHPSPSTPPVTPTSLALLARDSPQLPELFNRTSLRECAPTARFPTLLPRRATTPSPSNWRPMGPPSMQLILEAPARIKAAPSQSIPKATHGLLAIPNLPTSPPPAPVLYIQADQMNAVVPFEITGPATEAVPALFTSNATGRGQSAVLNQDGSVNSPSNPASRGSVISVFMTVRAS